MERENLRGIKGGTGTDEYEYWLVDDQLFWRIVGTETWNALDLNPVTIAFHREHPAFHFAENPFNYENYGGGDPGGSGSNAPTPINLIRTNFVGGYAEEFSLSHSDAYLLFDGMQNGLQLPGLLATIAGLQNLSGPAVSLLGAVVSAQDFAWGNIETNYMTGGNLDGITITKWVMTSASMPTPYETYLIKNANGTTIGTAGGPAY